MKKNRKAFTLVELLIVIAIIGILSVLGYAMFSVARRSARNTARSSAVKQEIYGFLQDFENKCKARPSSMSISSCSSVTLGAAGACASAQTYNLTPLQGITSCSVTSSCTCGISQDQLVVIYDSAQNKLGVCLEGSSTPEMVEGACAKGV